MRLRGADMQIHLFISDYALGQNRLKDELQEILNDCTMIRYQTPKSFGQMISSNYQDPVVSVIMIGKKDELSLLSEIEFFWDRSKTILILPDEEPETIKLANKVRPVLTINMDADFSNVVSFIEHIKKRSEGKPQ
jgi:hypothetical protein